MDNKELIKEFNKTIASWFNPIHLENILEQWEAFKLSKSENQTPDKDYEILYRGYENPHSEDSFCCELGCPIYSVKYLPTGYVFERGNKVLDEDGKEQIIDKFEVDNLLAGGIRVVFYTPFRASGLYFTKHIPKPLPLFKTHDGVDIFEGDNYWGVGRDNSLFDLSPGNEYSGKDITAKYFSTKQAAIEYTIMENKLQFSLADIKKHVHLSATELQALIDLIK